MRTGFKYYLLLILFSLLTACGSSPTSNYYRLSAHPELNASGNKPAVGIGPISVPEYLNRNGIVYSLDGNLLQIAPHDRWAEPLTDGIGRVLSINLAGLLDTQSIQTFPWPAHQAPDYEIRVTLLSLDATPGQAQLVAEWIVRKPAVDEVISRRISRLEQALGGDTVEPAQIAPAYSDLLAQLSEQIASAVREDLNTP